MKYRGVTLSNDVTKVWFLLSFTFVYASSTVSDNRFITISFIYNSVSIYDVLLFPNNLSCSLPLSAF